MNRPLLRNVRFGTVVIGVALAIQAGCGEKQPTAETTGISWNSPKMRDVKREWAFLRNFCQEASTNKSNAKPDAYRELLRMQENLFRKRFSIEDVRQLTATCESLPLHWREWSDFDKAVIRFIVETLVYSRDSESLVTLLSTRLPLRIGSWPIEFYLAQQATLNDPIRILGQAYSKCEIPEVRQAIAAAVRRAFGGLEIPGENESEFVANAMQWYEVKKQHLVVNNSNDSTGYFDESLPLEPVEGYLGQYEHVWSHRHPLFVTERSTEQPQSGRSQSDQYKPQTPPKTADGTPSQPTSWKVEGELAKLNGTWAVIEIVDNGQRVPNEKIKGARFICRKEKLHCIGPDGKKEDEFSVRLGSQQVPLAIDLVQMPQCALTNEQTTPLIRELQEETTAAIYELKGDTLRICLPRRGAWQRPTSFKAEKGSHQTLITLEQVKQ